MVSLAPDLSSVVTLAGLTLAGVRVAVREPRLDGPLDRSAARMRVDGRPALVDQEGPFGNPTSDSERTMITETTSRALVVIYAPARVDRDLLSSVLDLTATRYTEFAGATDTICWGLG